MSGNERAKFPEGKQKKFLERSKKQLAFDSWNKFAEEIGVHRRSLIDWKEEEYTIPLKVLKKVCDILGTEIPSEIEQKEKYWYTSKGDSSKGGRAVYEKYGQVGGDPEYRKKKWREWREKRGKEGELKGLFKRKNIEEPPRSSKLAEFVGVMLGDGGITPKQVTVSLNRKVDRKYIKVVQQMFKELFGLDTSILLREESLGANIVASSVNLVEFLIGIGLKEGNKVEQQVDVPTWIEKKNQFKIACARGLVDTDGCVFNHRYKVNGKWYEYKKLSFRNYSQPIINWVEKIFKEINLNPRRARDNDLRLDSIKGMKGYFEIIGSSNPKHLRKYRE